MSISDFLSPPRRATLLAFALIASLPASGQTPLPPDDSVVFGALDNGLRYAVMPNDEPPGRVSLRLLVEAGSLQETESQRGLAHFLEHMAFNGSENYPPGELIEYLQRLGMSFGADTNAHTGFDETVYKLELPENTSNLIDEGMQVLRDYAGGLLLLSEEIETERGVILSEKRDRDSVGYRTFVAYWEFLFPEARMPERFPIGIEEVIREAPRAEFVDFYRTWYRPDNMAVVVVGDVDPDATVARIQSVFGDLLNPDHPLPTIDLGSITEPALATKLHSEPEAPYTEVALMTLNSYHAEPDGRETRIRDMITAAANRIVSRRLEKLSKKADAPFTTGSAYFFDYLDFFELGGIEVTAQPDQWEEALGVVEQELRRALEHGFSEAEVAEVKAKMLNEYQEALKAASTRESRNLSAAIVRSFSRGTVFTSPKTEMSLAEEAMAKLTPESAQEALQDIWDGTGRFLFVSGNLQLDDADAELTRAFQSSQAVPVEAPQAERDLVWAYTDFGPAGEIVSEKTDDDIGVTQVTFANQVRFNFKSTDFEANTVLVTVRFGGGKLSMTEEQKGLALFADMAFTEGGLADLSIDELKRLLAGESVNVSFSVGDDFFSLGGGTTPEDFRRQMELITAYLTAPGYREDAARQARKAYEEMAIEVYRTVEGVWGNEVARFLAGGNFRFGFPSERDFALQGMDHLEAWLAEPLASSYLEVSVVGDIDFDSARTVVAQTLGALPKRADTAQDFPEARKSVTFPENTERQTFRFDSSIPKSLAAVYWPTADMGDIERTRRLNVLASIFRDRLRREIREKLGEGYSPYAVNNSSQTYRGYGYLFGLNFADPEKVDEVAEWIRELGFGLGEGNISEDERERALLPIQKYVEEYVRQNRYWLGRVLAGSSIHPEQMEWARTLPTSYAAVTLAELNGLAKEYLGAGPGLPIVIKPESLPTAHAQDETDL